MESRRPSESHKPKFNKHAIRTEGSTDESGDRLFWAEVRIYSWTRVHWIHAEVSKEALDRNEAFWNRVKRRIEDWSDTHLHQSKSECSRQGYDESEFYTVFSSIRNKKHSILGFLDGGAEVPLSQVREEFSISKKPAHKDLDIAGPGEVETIIQLFEHIFSCHPSGLHFRPASQFSSLKELGVKNSDNDKGSSQVKTPDFELNEAYENAELSDNWLFQRPAYTALQSLLECSLQSVKEFKNMLKKSTIPRDVIKLLHESTHPLEQETLKEVAYSLYAKYSNLRKDLKQVIVTELDSREVGSVKSSDGLSCLLELLSITLGKNPTREGLPSPLFLHHTIPSLWCTPTLPQHIQELAQLSLKLWTVAPELMFTWLQRICSAWPWSDSASQALLVDQIAVVLSTLEQSDLLGKADFAGPAHGATVQLSPIRVQQQVPWSRLHKVVMGVLEQLSRKVLESVEGLLRNKEFREGVVVNLGFQELTDLEVKLAGQRATLDGSAGSEDRAAKREAESGLREARWRRLAELAGMPYKSLLLLQPAAAKMALHRPS